VGSYDRESTTPLRQGAFVTVHPRDRRIIDVCSDTDEPTFVFRAQDRFSVAVLDAYRTFIQGSVDDDFQAVVEDSFKAFEDWQRLNPTKVKTPDLPAHSKWSDIKEHS
jgi:hypothetical protein